MLKVTLLLLAMMDLTAFELDERSKLGLLGASILGHSLNRLVLPRCHWQSLILGIYTLIVLRLN